MRFFFLSRLARNVFDGCPRSDLRVLSLFVLVPHCFCKACSIGILRAVLYASWVQANGFDDARC